MPICPDCLIPLPADRGRVCCDQCGASFHLYRGALVGRMGDVLRPERRAILVDWLWWARWYATVERSA